MSNTLEAPDGESVSSEVPILHSLQTYPGFRTLFNSTMATNGAFWMWNMAGGWLALDLTDSAFFVGLIGFLTGIPMLLFTLPAGVIIDRYDRRRILVTAQIVVAVIMASVVTLMFLDMMRPWHLMIASFGTGTAMTFVFPTRNALVANLVPAKDLANAVALNSAGQNAPRVVGPALAGPLIAAIGLSFTFLVCLVVQLIAVVVTSGLPKSLPVARGVRRTMLGSIGDGLLVIRRNQFLTGVFILAVVPTMFLMPYTNLLPVFARDVFSIGSLGLGLMMAANGLGGVIGSLLVAGSRWLNNRPGVLVWTAIGFGLLVLSFSVTPSAAPAIIVLFTAGLISAIYMALNNTQIQLSVDDSVRGRVLSVYLFTWGLLPLGVLPAGAIASRFGAPAAVLTMTSIGLALILLTAVRFPSLRGTAVTSALPASADVQRV